MRLAHVSTGPWDKSVRAMGQAGERPKRPFGAEGPRCAILGRNRPFSRIRGPSCQGSRVLEAFRATSRIRGLSRQTHHASEVVRGRKGRQPPPSPPCNAHMAHGLDEGGRTHPAKGVCGRKAPFKGPMDQRGLGAPPLTEGWDKGLQQGRPRGRVCAAATLQGGWTRRSRPHASTGADRAPLPRHGKAPATGLRPRGLSADHGAPGRDRTNNHRFRSGMGFM